MKNPMLLTYNLAPEKARKIRLAAMRFKIMVKAVAPEEQHLPVGTLCGLPVGDAEEACGEAFTDEMLVLAFFPQALMNPFLQAIRKAGAPVGLKAALTETNAEWSSRMLHSEIRSEHEALSGGNAPLHQA